MTKSNKKVVKKVKVWAWIPCNTYKPFVKEFGFMYSTEKEAKKGICKYDIVVPCTITYEISPKRTIKK